MENQESTFAQKHPKINFIIGLILIVTIIIAILWSIKLIVVFAGNGLNYISLFLKKFVNSTDKIVVVAMITGSVSIIGVVISSIVAKIIDYKYNVKKYLYDKREKPYEQFISMIYTIMEDTKKSQDTRMTETEMVNMVSEFSKGLTLWGSNKVVKKWLKYRKNSLQGSGTDSLIMLEDILYEMRKDVGLKKKMRKGDMLSFFINDIDNLLKK